MKTRSAKALDHAVRQIFDADGRPPDLLDRAGTLLRRHEEADNVYQWTMKLAPHLQSQDIEIMGRLLQHGTSVLRDGEPMETDRATTLPTSARQTIRELAKEDGEISGPTPSVLDFDVLNRAYNRTRRSEAPVQERGT